MPTGSVSQLIQRLQDGDSSAVRSLWGLYFPRLVALARSTLDGRPRRAADEEDAAVSAFTSFWEKADRGGFADLESRESLWALLSVITVRKALRQGRDEARQKRGDGQIVTETDITQWLDGKETSSPLTRAVANLSSTEFDQRSTELIEAISTPQLRAITILRMMDYTLVEIAEELELSYSQVRRKLRIIRTLLRDRSTDD